MTKKTKRRTTSKRSATSQQRAKPKAPTRTPPHTRAGAGTQGKEAAKPTRKATTKKKATQGQRARQKAEPATPASKATKVKRTGVLDAAVQVLKAAKKPMRCKEIIEVALSKSYWQTTGKTPHATLYSAMLREITNKGKDSRFKKVDRGLFELKAVSR